MKRIIGLFIATLLVFTMISGCSNSETNYTNTVSDDVISTVESIVETIETKTNNNETKNTSDNSSTVSTQTNTVEYEEVDLNKIDMSAWQYNSSYDVYWQVGITYCANPVDENYETLAIFVPGKYMDAKKNSDGTYTCTVNTTNVVNGYTSETAPVLFPVNTAGHKAQSPLTAFSKKCATYTDEGYIYVHAGCRGKDAGVPAGVTDLKAALRYLRYNEELLPGCMDRIVAFGHSGGGSQTAVLGSTGDSPMYYPYLSSIGAAATSDSIAAAMCWCPITGLDSADMGHEWSMGVTRTGLSSEMQGYSDALAAAYAEYVNSAGFKDEDGNLLTLETSDEGIYQAGSYYEYIKDVIEDSLENYLEDTSFPVSSKSGSYSNAEEYIKSLNSDTEWVTYDSKTGEVTILSIAEFSKHCKKASKPVAAFDKLESGGHELFNTGDGEMTHFDSVLYEIIKGSEYESDFEDDLSRVDFLGNSIEYRVNMFSPLYFLLESNDGYQTSNVATYWRIRSGITQSDTPLTTEINLALALSSYGADVDFETVWNQGHTQAERTGDATTNFIEWIEDIWK